MRPFLFSVVIVAVFGPGCWFFLKMSNKPEYEKSLWPKAGMILCGLALFMVSC
jgi:hypothetical protein